jgi:hypothetical protein
MSTLSKTAAEVSASRMPFPAASNPKTDSKTEMDVTKKSDAVAVTDEPSEPIAPESSRGPLKKARSFASIPVLFRPRNVKDKPDPTSANDVDIPLEVPKALADREILSRHQPPISQWPTYGTYVAMVADKRSTIPTSTKLDEAPRQTKREDILDYIYDWAAWAVEIPNETRRHEVLGWVMKTLERVLKDGIERTGIMLESSDVQGTKNGTKGILEGEVNIQVVITNSLKEKPGSELNKSAVQKAKDDVAKYKQANRGAATTIPLEPTVQQPLVIEHAAQASSGKTKRPVGELDEFRAAQDAKRQKIEVAKKCNKTLATNKADAQQEESREGQDRSTSESTTTEDDEKWVQYIQHIFLPRFNHILKRAGESLSRGKCRNWETVRERLVAAGVSVKYRNMMLRDFQHGHEKWDGDSQVDPNVELASFAESFQRPPKASPVVVANNANKQAVKKDAESNRSNIQTLLLTLEGLPVLNTEIIPAQPVTSSPFPIAHIPSPLIPTHQLTFPTSQQRQRRHH